MEICHPDPSLKDLLQLLTLLSIVFSSQLLQGYLRFRELTSPRPSPSRWLTSSDWPRWGHKGLCHFSPTQDHCDGPFNSGVLWMVSWGSQTYSAVWLLIPNPDSFLFFLLPIHETPRLISVCFTKNPSYDNGRTYYHILGWHLIIYCIFWHLFHCCLVAHVISCVFILPY